MARTRGLITVGISSPRCGEHVTLSAGSLTISGFVNANEDVNVSFFLLPLPNANESTQTPIGIPNISSLLVQGGNPTPVRTWTTTVSIPSAGRPMFLSVQATSTSSSDSGQNSTTFSC
jgi:hypothetical protein